MYIIINAYDYTYINSYYMYIRIICMYNYMCIIKYVYNCTYINLLYMYNNSTLKEILSLTYKSLINILFD